MTKTFKEYLGIPTIRVGGLDSIHPIASLGDKPPKGKGSRDSRAMGLQANNQSQGLGTIKPMITADAKKLQTKKIDNYKSKNKEDIKKIKESTLYKHMVNTKIIKD